MKHIFTLTFFIASFFSIAQSGYWQQHASYKMDVKLNVENHQITGTQELVYTNNSPDTLHQVFYHLYFNAFQPGSMMAVRSDNLPDTDKRLKGRFVDLSQSEIGFQKILSLKQNGVGLAYNTTGTILQVKLNQPILPGTSTTFSMSFLSQVPVQIRRSGRNNQEGIEYTMTQWYPKMAEYDKDGWHPDQYVEREYYGVFGNFDVSITLPKKYVVGGTGVLQNANEIGYGYSTEKVKIKRSVKELTWHFKAENVHDFAWAADPDFIHKSFQVEDGPLVHLLFDPKTANKENWENIEGDVVKTFQYMREHYGKYPYPQFSLIQGGDGGMEYPMCTMVLGSGKNYKRFFKLFVHEALHNWFYAVLGTNEQLYPWMDEGFTSFAEEEVMNFVYDTPKANPNIAAVSRYIEHVKSGELVPITTPADHYNSKKAYVTSSYYMGELFLMQMQYVIGQEKFKKGMKTYFNRWKFKHPTPADFTKVMEEVSGLQLDWLLIYWTQLVKTTDYALGAIEPEGPKGTKIVLKNLGERPMPVDVVVMFKNGNFSFYTIPLVSMYGAKEESPYQQLPPWAWTNPEYELHINAQLQEIESVQIDPFYRSCDVDPANNVWPIIIEE